MSILFYAAFAVAPTECVAVVESGGWSTNTMSSGVNVEVTRTNLS